MGMYASLHADRLETFQSKVAIQDSAIVLQMSVSAGFSTEEVTNFLNPAQFMTLYEKMGELIAENPDMFIRGSIMEPEPVGNIKGPPIHTEDDLPL